MKAKVKRNVCILAVVMIMVCLTACSSDAQMPGFDVSVRPADSSGTGSGTDNNAAGSASKDPGGSKDADTKDADINRVMTLPGAIVVESAKRDDGGYVHFLTSQSYTDVVAFYKEALQTIGAKEHTLVEGPNTREWGCRGSYGSSDTSIGIMIAPQPGSEDQLRVGVAYGMGQVTFYDLPQDSILRN